MQDTETKEDHGLSNARGWLASVVEMVDTYTAAEEADDWAAAEEAETIIHQSVLSVDVRTGWYAPGSTPEPVEAQILLTTGGPALRIHCNIGLHGQPEDIRLEYQDWFTPWRGHFEMTDDEVAALERFTQFFYFGDL